MTGGVPPCRLQLLRLPLLLVLGRIGVGQFNGSLGRLLADSCALCIASVSKRRHRGLRARGTWRCCDNGRWHRWSDGHGPRGLVGRRHGDHGRRRDRRGRLVTGPISAQGHLRRGRFGRGVCPWIGFCPPIGLRHDRCCSPLRGPRTGRGWRRRRPTGNRLLDPRLLHRLRDRRDRRPRGCDLRGMQYDAQVGDLDPSILPEEAEARKPKSLATEGQPQQQSVDQQREQQRRRQSPALTNHALAVGASLERATQACSAVAARDTAAGAVQDNIMSCAPLELTAHRSRPCQSTSETFVNRIRSIVTSTPVRLGGNARSAVLLS